MNLSKHQSKSHGLNIINKLFCKNLLSIKRLATALVSSISILLCFFIFLGITSVNSANSYALTYESQAGVGFTINDTIKLSITGDITIPELFPGTTEESNVINIKVSTNTKNGYSLSAKMGTTNADLTTTSSSPKFTGLPTNASESTLADNTWGYKIKTSDSSWSNYSGLPISTDTEKILVERNSQPTGGEETTQFKIGAHASTSMPANTYSNTIIFHAVAKQPPTHTITWNANGGTVSPTTSSIQYGKPIGTLPTPTYDGYNFLGWFTQAEGGEEVTPETRVTGDVTYFAQWEVAAERPCIKEIFYNFSSDPTKSLKEKDNVQKTIAKLQVFNLTGEIVIDGNCDGVPLISGTIVEKVEGVGIIIDSSIDEDGNTAYGFEGWLNPSAFGTFYVYFDFADERETLTYTITKKQGGGG